MIVNYRDKRTERFASGHHVKEFSGFARQVVIRLDRLDAATNLSDLGHCLAIDWKRSKVTAPDSFQSASTTNGGFALSGRTDHPAPLTWRSSIIIIEGRH